MAVRLPVSPKTCAAVLLFMTQKLEATAYQDGGTMGSALTGLPLVTFTSDQGQEPQQTCLKS